MVMIVFFTRRSNGIRKCRIALCTHLPTANHCLHYARVCSALRKDTCLYIVPGSHKVPRTPAQRSQSSTLDAPANPLDMPDAIRVTLQPGETVFYNNNILHCAAYVQHEERITLHACMGEVRGGPSRARNILQHRLGWMKEEPFKETLDERGRRMLEKIVRLQESIREVGYSLANK